MDLNTKYLGFDLPHPFMAGASPLADDLDGVRRLEDAGSALIVVRSLFEEQIVGQEMAANVAGRELSKEFEQRLKTLPPADRFVLRPQEYLDHIAAIRKAVSLPVVASLNGRTLGGWLHHAQLLQDAGADALELNIYELGADASRSGESMEQETFEMVRQLKHNLSISVAVKLSQFYTSLAHFAAQLDEAGADGLVIFNRFYQPDVDLEEPRVQPLLRYSDSSELLMRLRWLAILHGQIRADLAVTGGVHNGADAIKAILCGATAVQMVSALLENGVRRLGEVRRHVEQWMQQNGYASLEQVRGSMDLKNCKDREAFERTNYMRVVQDWQP